MTRVTVDGEIHEAARVSASSTSSWASAGRPPHGCRTWRRAWTSCSRRSRQVEGLRRLPLPGGEVEVVAPGGDLPVADLEHAGAGELDPLLPEAETVDALGEDAVAVRRQMDDLGLDLVGGQKEVQHLADAVLPAHRLERHVVVNRVVREEVEEAVNAALGPTSEKFTDYGLRVLLGGRHPERPPATRFGGFCYHCLLS